MLKLIEGEQVILTSRRHWWILTIKITVILFLALVPLLLYSFWGVVSPQITLPNEVVVNAFIRLALALYYTFLWLYFCIFFVDYFLDAWIITNMRILDIEQKGLFNREISECYLSNIQDITVVIDGVVPTFLNFGYLRIRTAAEKREFIFQQIPDPNKVKNVILSQYNEQRLATNN